MQEFLAKYPLPWRVVQVDPTGASRLLDANDQTMAILDTDIDWQQEDDTPKTDRPVFNGHFDGGDEAEAETLIKFLLERINGK